MNSVGIFTLIGTFVGGSITFIINYLQNKNQTSRDYIRIAYEMAKEDYNHAIDLAKLSGKPKKILPIESYLLYYIRYIKLIQKKDFEIENLEQLNNFRSKISDYYFNADR